MKLPKKFSVDNLMRWSKTTNLPELSRNTVTPVTLGAFLCYHTLNFVFTCQIRRMLKNVNVCSVFLILSF